MENQSGWPGTGSRLVRQAGAGRWDAVRPGRFPDPETSAAEEFMNALQRSDQPVDFFLGVVEVETRAGRAREAKFAHKRLVAVVAAAQGDTVLISESHHIVGVDIGESETDKPAALGAHPGANDADSGQRGKF